MSLRYRLSRSQHPAALALRRIHRAVTGFTLPVPKVVVRPVLWVFLTLRMIYYFAMRMLVCEPIFKAYCTSYGRGVRTGVFIHWVQGKGRILLGDRVHIDGKCSFGFANRFSASPTLTVGDDTGIGHGCGFEIGQRITIGKNCRIAPYVFLFDSSGHPADPLGRLNNLPPSDHEIQPIQIGDNVWIGLQSIIFPGVTIGEGSIVSAGSVVLSDVPAYTVVAGNPARKVRTLQPPTGTDTGTSALTSEVRGMTEARQS